MGVEGQVLFGAVKNEERLVCMGMLCWTIKRSSINESKPEARISLEEHFACVEESNTYVTSHRRDCLGTLIGELMLLIIVT